MSIQWKIAQFSNRRLEAEISHRYVEYSQFGSAPVGDRILLGLWDEFDRRMAAGKMTDDEEPILHDTRKY